MTLSSWNSVRDVIAHWAEATPDAPALVLGDERWTYAGTLERCDRLARAILAAGIGKGDRVAALLTPHPDYLFSLVAAASIGAIWVGLNPRYQRGEMMHVVQDSAPALLIARSRIEGRDYAEDIAALRGVMAGSAQVVIADGDPPIASCLAMAEFLAGGEAVEAGRPPCAGGLDPCLIVYTSGSTGVPKGALLHHQGIVDFAREQARLWPVQPMRAVNYFPINHIGCVIDLSMPCLAAGGTIFFLERYDTSACLALMEQARITAWMSVPTVFRLQLDDPEFGRYDLSAVQLIVWEGAAMPREAAAALRAICPRFATNYGMTETGSAITATEPTDDIEIAVESVGFAFPGVEIRLVDDGGREVAEGETGEVWARSPYLMLGYWRRPDATAEAFSDDGYFRTGDLAVRRPDGRYRIVGRLKEMFKSGGYNVYPREIEAVLEMHPAVALAAVVDIPDPVWQETGIAFVTLAGEASVADLEAWCRDRLANYKVPKRILIEPDLPLLPIGKVDKAALRRRARGGA